MDFKDYYKTLGLTREASADEVKTTYRRLARKFHPDLSKEPDAEARFKEIGEAYEVLKDTEKRAAYDEAAAQWERQKSSGGARAGQGFQPPPGWESAFASAGGASRGGEDFFGTDDHSDFFEALFGRGRAGGPAGAARRPSADRPGHDQHAKVEIDLEDAFRGARRSIVLRISDVGDDGRAAPRDRTLDVSIPKGIREGQQLRLAGQGSRGSGQAPAGDLYLEIAFRPHPRFRIDGRDVLVDLPVTPWEAALGADVTAPTPEGPVELTIPKGSAAGRQLRLRGRGIPGQPAGDLYVVLGIALPPADTPEARAAYERFRDALPFDPRQAGSSGTGRS